MKKAFLTVLFLIVLATLGVGGFAIWFVTSPASSSNHEVIVEIPKGSGTGVIAVLLKRNGVVKDARLFKLYVRVLGKDSALRAGEFLLRQDMSPSQVLDMLVNGEIVLHKLTVPEGFRAKEIAAIVQASGLGDGAEFLALTENAAFAHELGIPADRLEGYLFPDTYNFPKNIGSRGIATSMVKRFLETWTPDFQARVTEKGLSMHEAVTLASIVEKETGAASERPIIAGLFYNRLTKKMRLETDPTIIYGMKDYAGNIRKKDINDKTNVYNTYVIPRLPPGPIASPGGEALRAVAYPSKHDFIFFMATRDGGAHEFSKTYAEHQAAVKRYLQRRRTQRHATPPATVVAKPK